MPLADASFAAAALSRKEPLVAGAATADAALAAAFLAAKSEAAATQERVRAAALAWEGERSTANTLTRRIAEVLVPPVVPFTEHAHLKAYEHA